MCIIYHVLHCCREVMVICCVVVVCLENSPDVAWKVYYFVGVLR